MKGLSLARRLLSVQKRERRSSWPDLPLCRPLQMTPTMGQGHIHSRSVPWMNSSSNVSTEDKPSASAKDKLSPAGVCLEIIRGGPGREVIPRGSCVAAFPPKRNLTCGRTESPLRIGTWGGHLERKHPAQSRYISLFEFIYFLMSVSIGRLYFCLYLSMYDAWKS